MPSVPAWHDQAQGIAVLWLEWSAVHRPGEQHVVAHGGLEGQAPLVVLLQPTLEAAVESGEDDLTHALPQGCLFQQQLEGRACPV
jgi:hypothetical protein